MWHRYEAEGIAYAEADAEDFEDYPLLECHLQTAAEFVLASRPGGALIHCFAGVNRSAALAIAVVMVREKLPLLRVVSDAFAARPFILSNESFRRQLVRLAAEHGLLREAADEPHAVEPVDVALVRSR